MEEQMKTARYFGLMEAARKTGISYWRIIYAEHAGRLPEPGRIARKRVYGDKDVERIRRYFGRKEAK
jgi:DNA-binding transcriptional MerR regulator